jgi:hypothetical protein
MDQIQNIEFYVNHLFDLSINYLNEQKRLEKLGLVRSLEHWDLDFKPKHIAVDNRARNEAAYWYKMLSEFGFPKLIWMNLTKTSLKFIGSMDTLFAFGLDGLIVKKKTALYNEKVWKFQSSQQQTLWEQ